MFVRLLTALSLLSFSTALLAAEPTSTSAPAGFTNVTKESGVADIVARQHEYVAKVLAAKGDPEYKTWWLNGITLMDLSGNGALDLLIEGHGQPAVAAYNDGKGHFTMVDLKPDIARGKNKKNDIPYPGGEIRCAFDLDEDGRLDLLASYGDNAGVTYLNDCKKGNPPSWNFKAYDPGFDAFSRSIAFIDLNRDGFVDYLMTGDEGRGKATHPMHVHLGKGQGKWEASADIDVLKEAAAIPCDINGDGFIDLLSSQCGYNPGRRWILLNDGKMNFRNATTDCGLSEDGSIIGIGDLNQDGYTDLICIDQTAQDKDLTLQIYFNDGKGRFTKRTEIANFKGPLPRMATSCVAAVADFDNDGIPDIIASGKSFLWILHGLGGGKFEQVNDGWGLPNVGPISFGDIDGDGMLDILTSGPGPNENAKGVAVYHNNLPKKHWLNVQLLGKAGNRSAAGSIIRVTEPGTGKLIWFEQVSIWGRQSFHSYYAAANTERHIGLGDRQAADVTVEFYPSGKKVEAKGVKADRTVVVEEEAKK